MMSGNAGVGRDLNPGARRGKPQTPTNKASRSNKEKFINWRGGKQTGIRFLTCNAK